MNINPNPAIPIEVRQSDTFDDFARDVATDSHVSLRPFGIEPKDANPENDVRTWKIEVEPGSNRSIIELDLEEILTPEQFAAMMPYVQEMVAKVVAAKIIKPTTFRGIRTLLTLFVPSLEIKIIMAENREDRNKFFEQMMVSIGSVHDRLDKLEMSNVVASREQK